VKFENPSAATIRDFLLRIRTVAVVGLSPDPDRPSYSVAMYLQAQGFRIVPVRPGGGVILGEQAYDRLADIPFPVDAVDLFRASRFVAAHVDEAILCSVPAVWMQEGVIDLGAAQKARDAGLFVAMDLCLLKEHRKSGIGRVG
jgi:uncharacterized protein